MPRFIFFTKTNWSEPPRLRHQLANLLADNGNEVIFFESPSFIFKDRNKTDKTMNNISFHRSQQLIHHKLRLHPILHYVNAAYEKKSLNNLKASLKFFPDDIIINFNYDYFYIKDLFPKNKLITIINDDFWCRAIMGYTKPLEWAIKETCYASDLILAVSIPLKNQLSKFCTTRLFYPWATQIYKKPEKSSHRKTLLFWGYINDRLNFDFIFQLADALIIEEPNMKIHFIGPIQKRNSIPLERLLSYKNIEISGPQNIENLVFDDVLAAFIPYVAGNKADDVTTIPNKAFPMLANGLPLAITGMPDFIDKPFVFRLGVELKTDLKTLKELQNKFMQIQPSIEDFVAKNTGEHRIKQLMGYL